jgi:hypothetical protein
MRTVRVRLNAADLSDEMIVMRGWLDRNRYEATRFDCNQDGDVVVLSVDFAVEAIASAFARRFGGQSGQSLSSALMQLALAGNTARNVRGRPMRRDREDELDLTDIRGETDATTHWTKVASPRRRAKPLDSMKRAWQSCVERMRNTSPAIRAR